MPYLAGNPLYIWCALELKRYFDIEEPLGPDNAEEIYRRTNQRIRQLHMTPGWCLERSGVELLSTTEDPADSLEYHIKIKENAALKTRILTAFRPDRAFYCERKTFSDYMKILSQAAGQEIVDFSSMMGALEQRLAFLRNLEQRSATTALPTLRGRNTPGPRRRTFFKRLRLGSSYQRWK